MKQLTALTLFFALLVPQVVMGQEPEMPERFNGVLLDFGGAVAGRSTAQFTLVIEKYSTVEDINDLLRALSEGGQDGLTKALSDLDLGYIRIGGSIGYPISAARSYDVPGGRIIRVLTDRQIQMYEVMRSLRSLDYPLGIIEIQLPENGKKGSGQLIAAGQITMTKEGGLEIESLGTTPFRLQNVSLAKKKKKK